MNKDNLKVIIEQHNREFWTTGVLNKDNLNIIMEQHDKIYWTTEVLNNGMQKWLCTVRHKVSD